jgi:hypothetical protein
MLISRPSVRALGAASASREANDQMSELPDALMGTESRDLAARVLNVMAGG